jgi:hypothetical protein
MADRDVVVGEETVGVGSPAEPVEEGALAHPLTFFLTADQRARVLGKLRRADRHRTRALLKALRVEAAKGKR